MPEAAKLSTGNFKIALFLRFKPDRDGLSGDHVLFDAHDRKTEAVDHVLGRKSRDHGRVHRNMKLIERDDVVGAVRIARIQPQGILGADPLQVRLPKNTVLAGIMNVPGELLGDDSKLDGFIFLRKLLMDMIKNWKRKCAQKQHFGHRDADLQVSRKLEVLGVIMRLMAAFLAEF